MMMIETPAPPVATVELAQTLLRNLTDEAYRFFSTSNGPIIRPAGAQAKRFASDYARTDAQELQEILVESNNVRALVNAATNVGYTLHLMNITEDGCVIFAKEVLGVTYEEVEYVSARL